MEGNISPKRVVTLRAKGHTCRNEIQTEPLWGDLFLEFGRRVGEDYEYIALMKGNPDYTKNNEVQQLYFTHFMGGKWRLLDDTCLKLVEDYDTRDEVVKRLREIAVVTAGVHQHRIKANR